MPDWVLFKGVRPAVRSPSAALDRQLRSVPMTVAAAPEVAAPRYDLCPPPAAPSWGASMRAVLGRRLGDDPLGRRALALVAGSLAPSTAGSYGSAFESFLQFCSEDGLSPFAVGEQHVVRYVAWLGERGQVAAASLQPYLSAINRFLADHCLPAVALGPLVQRARKGLQLQQVDTRPQPVRVGLPPGAVLDCMAAAEQLLPGCAAAAPGRDRLVLFRALLAVVLGYIFPGRGSTSVALKIGEVLVDESNITVLHLKVKGRVGEPDHTKPMLVVPVEAHPRLAALLRAWRSIQRRQLPGAGAGAPFWLLPGEQASSWTAATLTAWLHQACRAVGCSPPPGLSFSSHSLRKGAATHMSAVGVSLPIIRFFGGWARDSSVVLDYIDPAALPSPAAFELFGWLVGRSHSG